MGNNMFSQHLHYLEEQYKMYLLSNNMRDKSRIETSVRSYVKAFSDDLYLELNEGSASGLCEHGFFESDLSKCINMLRNKLFEDYE